MRYVIWTTTGKEDLIKKEFETIVPQELYRDIKIFTRERKLKYHGVWQMRKERLFPGYLFLEADPEKIQDIQMALKRATEFSMVLKSGNELVPIREEEERFIRRLAGDTTNVTVSIGVIENEKVIIKEGPLIGMEGMIKHIDRHKRMALLEVEMFNRLMEVKVGLEIVEKNHE